MYPVPLPLCPSFGGNATFLQAGPAQRLLEQLPVEMLHQVAGHLDWESLRALRATSWHFRDTVDDTLLDARMRRETRAGAPLLDALLTLEAALRQTAGTERTCHNADDLLQIAAMLRQNMASAIEAACPFVGDIARWPSPVRRDMLNAIFAAVEAMKDPAVHDWASQRLVVFALAAMNERIGFALRSPLGPDRADSDVRATARNCYQQLVGDQLLELRRQWQPQRLPWGLIEDLVTDHLPLRAPHPDAPANLLFVARHCMGLPIEDGTPACEALLRMAKQVSYAAAVMVFRELQRTVGVVARRAREAEPLILAGE